MTDKEVIKTFEKLKRNKEIVKNIDKDFFFEFGETALNLIQTQQAEIEKLRNNNKDLLRKLRNRVKEVKKLTKYSLYKKEFSTLNEHLKKKDKMIDEIQKEVRDHIGFENRLKRDNKEPDLFNQGRFYVANNINNILKGK